MQAHLQPAPRSDRAWMMISAFLICLHLAKCGLFIAVGQPPMVGDARHYWGDGERMAAGDWLMVQGDVETIRTPGYPFFLALFQVVFGSHSLIAASVSQQLMVFVTAITSAWICVRVSGSRWGGVLGLSLGLFCISQNSLADYLLSDTLFTLLLTLAVAAFVAWLDRPSITSAVAIGLLVGLATLVRPIAQFAGGPIILTMAFHGWKQLRPRRLLLHVAALLVVLMAVLAPWYARNYRYCGQPFLSKTAGLTMWASIFRGSPDNRLDPAMPFADAPKTNALLARLEGVDLRSHWDVLRALQKQQVNRSEANDLMQAVSLESIRAYPWRFIDSRLRRFVWFWITPNGTYRPQTQGFHMGQTRADSPNEGWGLLSSGDYCGQAHWRWDGYYRDAQLNWLWLPNPWLYLSVAGAAACGLVGIYCNRRQRRFAIGFGLLLVYFGVMTAIGAPPEYRYRMPLEPIVIASLAPMFAILLSDICCPAQGVAAEIETISKEK